MEEYGKTLHIEALTMLDMVKKQILPAVTAQVHEWLDTAADEAAAARCEELLREQGRPRWLQTCRKRHSQPVKS